jgi:NAD(P)-dependent dehydrogenase (short-subunit alcohol dehydrogenase family)/carbon monoxide dehydrogenase subunit G
LPVTRLHEIIEVPAPIGEVFRYTSDFSNIEQWDPGVNESSRLGTGPLGEGSRFRVVVKAGLSSTPMEYVITCYEPPRRVVLEGRGAGIEAIDEIRFMATDGATRIEYAAEIRLGGVAGLMQPLLGGVLERVGRRAIAGLKEALSTEPPVPGESAVRNLLDRMVLPGAVAFTRFGYRRSKRGWAPLTVSLQGRTVVVTGATAGLGRAAAERLAELQARVVLVGRSRDKLEQARREIAAATGNHQIAAQVADLSLMAEVRSLARRLLEQEPAIHVLINNAAVLPAERALTAEGLETAFATDLLSPFLLTRLLLPRLRASAPSRIVNVSSGGMYLSGLDVNDLQSQRGRYDGSRAYAQAKRGLMMLTELWAGELADSGVVVNAMHPGWADTPGVQASLPGFHRLTRAILRTAAQGADTIAWLAAAPEAGRVSGKFWLDRQPHLAAILPGTAGSERQRRALLRELNRLAELPLD